MATARITITLKPTVLDAQGEVVCSALHALGFESVERVHMGKFVELELADGDEPRPAVEAMCSELLANPVFEDCRIEIGE